MGDGSVTSTLSRFDYYCGSDRLVGPFCPLEKICLAQGEGLSQENRGQNMDGTRVKRSA